MRRLLAAVVLCVLAIGARAQACEIKSMTFPVPYSELVAVAPDGQLPLDSCAWFSVEKLSDQAPQGIAEAADMIIEIMPHWMQLSLQRPHRDFTCMVSVNDRDFVSILIGAQLEYWRDRGGNTLNWLPGQDGDDVLLNAIDDEVCRKVSRSPSGPAP
ncbi:MULTISPECIES: hypothetical protein [Dyella]|uniref:Uncharacterized protein n=2 Tax=Dyella TaxID=231454 RepID=A0A4V2NKV5_9GAMM|nr:MULTISPECIES: hypothetical protein [Dyella]TBR36149.1 hypothetical protein EYV96_16275 [Dyella terrae]TCI06198.1 hypothetical protein EZM97_35365 [Dyella soli]